MLAFWSCISLPNGEKSASAVYRYSAAAAEFRGSPTSSRDHMSISLGCGLPWYTFTMGVLARGREEAVAQISGRTQHES